MKKNIIADFLMVNAVGFSLMGTTLVPKVFAQTQGQSSKTVNSSMQTEAKYLLDMFMKEFKTSSGEVAILDPQTGKILWDQNGSSIQAVTATPPAPVLGAKFIFPAQGVVTNGFSPGHPGVDISNPNGSPIWAAAAGTVIKTNSGCASNEYRCGGGYGNYVIIDHGGGLQTLYAHLVYFTVKSGDHVTQGQVIGKMGSTGNVGTPPSIHLHFEVRLNGVKQLPSNYY